MLWPLAAGADGPQIGPESGSAPDPPQMGPEYGSAPHRVRVWIGCGSATDHASAVDRVRIGPESGPDRPRICVGPGPGPDRVWSRCGSAPDRPESMSAPDRARIGAVPDRAQIGPKSVSGVGPQATIGTELKPSCCYDDGFQPTGAFDRIIANFGASMDTTVLFDPLPVWAREKKDGNEGAFHKGIHGSLASPSVGVSLRGTPAPWLSGDHDAGSTS